MNSASLSTKREINQGQATRSTLTWERVIHLINRLLRGLWQGTISMLVFYTILRFGI